LGGAGVAFVFGLKMALLYALVVYLGYRQSGGFSAQGAAASGPAPRANRSIDYATTGGTTSMSDDKKDQNGGNNGGNDGFSISSFFGGGGGSSQGSQKVPKYISRLLRIS